jgi:two-component system, OmpR family, sensor histidine kinase VanS
MKYSIKKQFTIIFVTLMAGTIILNWILSNSFLESYYINNKTKVLLTVYDNINQAAENNEIGSDEFVEEFQEIANTFNINMIILDNEAKMLYATDNDISRLSKILSDKIFMVTPEQIDEVEALFNGTKKLYYT